MPSYVLTTPVHNELEMLPRLVATIDALIPRPALWLVVDDGSTDGSRDYLEARALERPFMLVASAPHAGNEYLGGHVAKIKRFGLSMALEHCAERGQPVDYLGVLDADMELPRDHYARLIAAFDSDPKLGIVSSVIASQTEAGTHVEPFQREDLPRGGTQFFRRECLEAIGGLPPWPGFDSAANGKARLLGYRTKVLTGLVAVQRRATAMRFGAAPGFERKGKYAWFLGMHPLLIAARAIAYSLKAPHSRGLHFARGWLTEAVRRAPRCPDEALRRENGWPRVARAAKAALGWGERYIDDDAPQRGPSR